MYKNSVTLVKLSQYTIDALINYYLSLEKGEFKTINEIVNYLLNICKVEKTLEDILKEVFDYYKLTINETQYVLISSTIKSYLSYLIDEEKMEYYFNSNKMYFKTILTNI